jgi:hypothetical protein
MGMRASLDTIFGKPLKRNVAATILCGVAGLSAATGFAFWNGSERFEKPLERRSQNPFYKLKIRRLTLSRNVSTPASNPGFFLDASSAPGEKEAAPKPPVPYLPYTPKPAPPSEAFNLSPSFMETLHKIASAKLEQGGIGVPDEYMPDPDDPGGVIPTPEDKIGPTNGSLLLHVEVIPDKQHKGTVIFRVSWELYRQLYIVKDSSYTTPHKMQEGEAGPFRVWEKHLESAIIYELEKLIEEQILKQYRAANPDTKGM